mmetsp:Transcript_1293/g.2959  ORF Transcript_1293/g.2959 Transcript_1293/m.2959 type:complete len:330 (+) Transcript_1293:64-1053(+)
MVLWLVTSPLLYVWSWLAPVFALAALVGALSYAVPYVLLAFAFGERDLKQRYATKWALVTGGSSGIGRALVERCAAQGLNVVVVALDDALLHDLVKALGERYAPLEFRAVGVDLGRSDGAYMDAVRDATRELDVGVVFCNAGFITTGFFAETSAARLLANVECNSTSAVRVAHHFAPLLRARARGGALCFTSSPVHLMPAPFSAIYGATKAFLTAFASALAIELRADGVDVCVCHPSPVSTRFYTDAHDLDAINFFKRKGVPPTDVAAVFFRAIGRVVVADHGWFPVVTTLASRIVHFNLLADVMKFALPLLPDYQVAKKSAAVAKKAD